MIQLRDKKSGSVIGKITEEQLQFLIDQLEEEFDEDKDYYLNRTTLDMLRERGADKTLMEILERALGSREGAEIEWSRV